MTALKQIKEQDSSGYTPSKDFYKEIRQAIVSSRGSKIGRVITHVKKQPHYDPIQTGWNGFIGNNSFTSFPVIKREWVYNGLTVLVNPEIVLESGGIKTYYKLWFKTEPIGKRNAELIYQMMYEMIAPKPGEDICILNVRKSSSVKKPNPLPTTALDLGLKAEVAHLLTLWPAI
jgi:hypothetical protein